MVRSSYPNQWSSQSMLCFFQGYLKLLFKATLNGKKSKQGCEIRGSHSGPYAPGSRTSWLCHPCSFWFKLLWSYGTSFWFHHGIFVKRWNLTFCLVLHTVNDVTKYPTLNQDTGFKLNLIYLWFTVQITHQNI